MESGPEWETIVGFMALGSILLGGAAPEFVKRALWRLHVRYRAAPDDQPLWWSAMLRLVAVGVPAGLSGWAGGVCWREWGVVGTEIGIVVGATGGIVAVALYRPLTKAVIAALGGLLRRVTGGEDAGGA